MNETNVTRIKTNFHFNASDSNGSALSVNNVNNFYFHSSSTAGDVEPVKMTKDTSITQPDRMTKDTSITDRAIQKADEEGNNGLEIANNFYWNGGLSGSVENNFYFGQEDALPDRMTKDTSITKPDRMTKDTSITGPSRMTKDTSITKPDRMTKDTSITDRATQKANESGNNEAGVVNNFNFGDGFSGYIENSFFFGADASDSAGKANDTRPSRATNPGQSTGDPAELPDVPNVDHQHIK